MIRVLCLWIVLIGLDAAVPTGLDLQFPMAQDAALPPRFTAVLPLPDSFASTCHIAFYVSDKDGLWFQTAWQTPTPGAALNFSSEDLSPRGHGGFWSPERARRSHRWGFLIRPGDTEPIKMVGLSPRLEVTPLTEAQPKQTEAITDIHWLNLEHQAWSVSELAFQIPRWSGNPYDPDQIRINAVIHPPSGDPECLPAFFTQPHRRLIQAENDLVVPHGPAGWRLRYTPRQAGLHRLELRQNNQPLSELSFTVNAAPPRGFPQRSTQDPRFLETADGTFFYPLGHNIHSPTDERSEELLGPLRGTLNDIAAYEHYFARMQTAGQNAVVMWMSNWWCSIEWSETWQGFHGLRDYHQANAARLDAVFAAATKHGIHILLVLDNHGRLGTRFDSEWADSPYNRRNGGPCATPEEFFSSHQATAHHRARLRYVVARWGAQPHLLGWEIVSEINLAGSNQRFAEHPSLSLWAHSAALDLRAMDPYKHPIGYQFSDDYHSVITAIAGDPAIDCLWGDAYKSAGSIVPLMLATAEANLPYGKPTWTVEFGGAWNASTPSRIHGDLHAGLWSNAMTMTAGAPACWWYQFIDARDLYREYGALGRFLHGVDKRGWQATTSTVPVNHPQRTRGELECLALSYQSGALAWVYDTATVEVRSQQSRMWNSAQLAVPVHFDGQAVLEIWDTSTGHALSHQSVTVAKHALSVTLPPFRNDIAIKIEQVAP
ncbi:MAG: hypothetical protein PF961_23245 [Planctomycetota bacterium]|jgi:hypothetical protein|nr:hypothetical protein [Planctomycetota bacterium]